MRRVILSLINIIAVLAFFVGIAGIDAGYFLASSIICGISLGWLLGFAFANGR